MFPILYETVTEGTVPSDNGLGILNDALDCKVVEERNGVYELQMSYPASGIHAGDILERRILKAKPNFTDDPQLFRIYKIGKVLGGAFTVYARHISYDLSGKPISTGTANNIVAAFNLLHGQATNYTFYTDKSTQANFKITEPSSVRSWLGGKEGSILDVFGTAEYKYDNYTVNCLSSRGTNRGVVVRYGKNLLALSQERDSSNIITAIIAYWKNSETNDVVIGNSISTGVTLDVPNVKTLDCSQDFEEAPTVAQLDAKANEYLGGNNVSTPTRSITLNFLQIGTLKDRVDLCDTVKIIYEDFGIEATAKCIKTTWDVIKEKYVSIELGEPKTNITDTIISNAKETASKPSTTAMAQAIDSATSLITGNQGGNLIIHDSNNDGMPDELLVMNTADISTATKVWRFNLNGLGYSNTGYSGTYGLALTMDGAIVATKITTGTLDCSRITVTHLSASSIDTGIITDQAGKNSWNMNTGAAKFTSLNIEIGGQEKALTTVLNGKCDNNQVRTKFAADATSVTISSGTVTFNSNTFIVNSTNFSVSNTGVVKASDLSANSAIKFYNTGWTTKYAEIGAIIDSGNTFPALHLNRSNGTPAVRIYADWRSSFVGAIETYQSNGNLACEFRTVNNGGFARYYSQGGTVTAQCGNTQYYDFQSQTWVDSGLIDIKDSGGNTQIIGNGYSGNLRCVTLTQTSSRKVKKNIEPMTDEEGLKILKLTPVTYDFKIEGQGTNMRGFIAEDTAEIIPELVKDKDEDLPQMDYIEIIPYLLKVLQIQEQRIKDLEDKDK